MKPSEVNPMKYKLLLLDIDGTLRPGSCERVPRENAEAVCAVQKAGVKIAIATGRGRIGVGKGLLRSIRPDYWVCAGGAQLVDYKGADLALRRLTTEEMTPWWTFLKITTCRCGSPSTMRTTPILATRSSPGVSERKTLR